MEWTDLMTVRLNSTRSQEERRMEEVEGDGKWLVIYTNLFKTVISTGIWNMHVAGDTQQNRMLIHLYDASVYEVYTVVWAEPTGPEILYIEHTNSVI